MSFEVFKQSSSGATGRSLDVHPRVLAVVARQAEAAGLSTEPDHLEEDVRYLRQKGLATLSGITLASTVEVTDLE